MKKQILLPNDVSRELRTTFKVHQVVLNRALRYEGNSSRDRMLRAAALQRGGVVYLGAPAPKGFRPNVETSFSDGWMHQNFGNRIEIAVHLDSNKTTIYIDGKSVASFSDMAVQDWGDMLYSMQTIYNRLNA